MTIYLARADASELDYREVAECEECFALVRTERMPAHEAWHNRQDHNWRQVWTGETR